MFAFLNGLRKPVARLAVGMMATMALVSCDVVPTVARGGGPSVDASQPVTVALLVPKGAGGGAGQVGRGLENAARLAVADLQGAEIDLRVYDTAGSPAGASSAASQAVNDGAQIILGPLYSQSVSAVVPVVAGRDINVLAFSNNTAVAGGNIFVLGQTFAGIADRLTSYASRQGRRTVAVVHGDDLAGQTGRDAIVAAARSNGMSVTTVQSYPLSQQGIVQSGPRIANAINDSGASAVFLTAGADSDLPLIADTLPDNGVDPEQVRFLGLTNWSSAPQALALSGLQGGLFTLPDQNMQQSFNVRYRAAYGSDPQPLASLGYDAVQAVGSLLADGRSDALTRRALTQSSGFAGASGVFRLLPNGTNQRALAVAQVQNNQVTVLDPAPRRFGAAGF